MNHIIVDIKTPQDFVQTLLFDDYQVIPLRTRENSSEGQIHSIICDIFNDLPLVDLNDAVSVDSYAKTIEKPLKNLLASGFRLIGLITSGLSRNYPGAIVDGWRRVFYLIIPEGVFFSVNSIIFGKAQMNKPDGSPVHKFNPGCKGVVEQLIYAASGSLPINMWKTRDAVWEAFGANIPWCPHCCNEEVFSLN